MSQPPKPPRPSQGPQAPGQPQAKPAPPKPPQPKAQGSQPPKPPLPRDGQSVDQSVPRPLGPKRVTRSVPAPQIPAELDEDEMLKAQLLAEVVEHAHRETRAVMLARVMESYGARPFIVTLLAILALIVTGYSYATRSEWVFGAPVGVSAQREGYLRFAMFLAAQRVSAYRDSMHVLPGSLAEVGESWPGVTYRASGDTLFELSARGDSGQVMTLRSDRDARTFVGLSPTALRRNIPANGSTP